MSAFTRDPLVRVGSPRVESQVEPGGVAVAECLWVTCSHCGELTGYEPPEHKPDLVLLARAHADRLHAGLVEAEGWAR